MALEGDLGEFHLTDIIQLIDLSKKTGAVFLQGRRAQQQMEGWLYFRDGKIMGAQMGNLPPLEAGEHVITLRAIGAGGLNSAPLSHRFTVAPNQAPTVSWQPVPPSQFAGQSQGQIQVSFAALDDVGTPTVSGQIDSQEWVAM